MHWEVADEPHWERNWNNWELWKELLELAAQNCVIAPNSSFTPWFILVFYPHGWEGF